MLCSPAELTWFQRLNGTKTSPPPPPLPNLVYQAAVHHSVSHAAASDIVTPAPYEWIQTMPDMYQMCLRSASCATSVCACGNPQPAMQWSSCELRPLNSILWTAQPQGHTPLAQTTACAPLRLDALYPFAEFATDRFGY